MIVNRCAQISSPGISRLLSPRFLHLFGGLVPLEHSLWELHGVTTERITELLGAHELDDSGLALLHLALCSGLQRWANLINVVYLHSNNSHRFGDACEAWAVQVCSNIAVAKPKNLVLFLSTPLAVIENADCDGDVLT